MTSPSSATTARAEMVATERFFVHEIRTCLEVFIRPLKLLLIKDPIVTAEECTLLECNLEAIFALSKNLLWELERKKLSPGQILSDEAENLRVVYVKFVSMYLEAYELHTRLMRERRKRKNSTQSYAQFVEEATDRQRQRIRGRNLLDFLILPIQRVPRYRLLLIEIWKKYEPGLERDWAKEAVLRISAVATEMNRSLAQQTSQRKLIRQETVGRLKLIEGEEKTSHSEEEEDIFAEEDKFLENIESLSVNLYRMRNPTLFNLDVTNEDDEMEGKDENSLVTREEELERACMSCGWWPMKKSPTTNPFVLWHLVTRPEPFLEVRLSSLEEAAAAKSKKTHRHHHPPPPKKPSAMQITMHLLKNVYSPMLPSRPFHPGADDIVVVGPVRCGQTPVLHILESLRCGNVVPCTSLLDRVSWLESDDWAHHRPLMSSANLSAGRLVKTHARLTQAFGGVLVPTPRDGKPDFRVVAVLRHPADLRLSLYRHCRRLYRKCSMTQAEQSTKEFDSLATVNDFASSLPFYESFVADVIRVAYQLESPQIKVVFYEQLLAQPKRVIQQLGDFTGLLEQHVEPNRLVDEIAHAVKNQMEFPIGLDANRRVGSTGQGRDRFSPQSLAKMDSMWAANVTSPFPKCSTYEALYLTQTQSLVPGTTQLPPNAGVAIPPSHQSTTISRPGSFTFIGQSVIAPISRFARSGSFSEFLGLRGGSQGAVSIGTSRGSRVSMPFETGVKAEELTRPRQGTFASLSRPGSLLMRRTESIGRLARSTHLGVVTRVRTGPTASKRASDMTTKSDLSTSTDTKSSKPAAAAPNGLTGTANDPDDSDDESGASPKAGNAKPNVPNLSVVPNLIGQRM